MTFLNSAKIKHAHASLRVPKRDLEERLFYRRRASPRFYTAKTHNGSGTLLLGSPVACFEAVDLTTVNFKHLLRIACGRLRASSPQASSLRNPVFLPTRIEQCNLTPETKKQLHLASSTKPWTRGG